jgi:beta-carotene ketolase (CrtW type)
MASWGGVLLYSLRDGLGGGVLRAVFLVALMTWLYTALFIVAHDAMHALVAPRHRRLNHAVGALAAALYAQFKYEPLRAAHAEHHRAPASLQARP